MVGALLIALLVSAGTARAALTANGLTAINGISVNGLNAINGLGASRARLRLARAAIWTSNGVDPSRPLSATTGTSR